MNGIMKILILTTLVLILWGCSETRHTVRQIDSHAQGEVNTVLTGGEEIFDAVIFQRRQPMGVNFWLCQDEDERLVCQRICDPDWRRGRTCEPRLHREFGKISRPSAGIAVARLRAEMDGDPRLIDSDEVADAPEEDPPAGDEKEEEFIREEADERPAEADDDADIPDRDEEAPQADGEPEQPRGSAEPEKEQEEEKRESQIGTMEELFDEEDEQQGEDQ